MAKTWIQYKTDVSPGPWPDFVIYYFLSGYLLWMKSRRVFTALFLQFCQSWRPQWNRGLFALFIKREIWPREHSCTLNDWTPVQDDRPTHSASLLSVKNFSFFWSIYMRYINLLIYWCILNHSSCSFLCRCQLGPLWTLHLHAEAGKHRSDVPVG